MTNVLIVEDEESLADPLAFLLRKEGFEATVVSDGPSALAEFERAGADIVLLDLMLPGMSGTDVCKQLRSRSSVPVIMVTARDSEIDKVVGLELGADDYVTKPYSARELIARIRAVLRRGADADDPAIGDGVLEAGPVRMDVERHVVSVNGELITLPLKEFDLLEYLMRNSGRVLTRGTAHRPGVGRRLRRGHQNPRCPRQAVAVEDRGRPGQPGAPGDGARPWLQVGGLRFATRRPGSPDARRSALNLLRRLHSRRQLRDTPSRRATRSAPGAYDCHTCFEPTCASGVPVQYQSRSAPPSPQPRRSYSVIVVLRTCSPSGRVHPLLGAPDRQLPAHVRLHLERLDAELRAPSCAARTRCHPRIRAG